MIVLYHLLHALLWCVSAYIAKKHTRRCKYIICYCSWHELTTWFSAHLSLNIIFNSLIKGADKFNWIWTA
ncbi:Uncharacterized protein TCM_002597 [Theobroma cacao]|uniref:Secreted protein n=1 Tax=Theobroma cacao TaxID=3641 RepID=A0A061DMS2_THECC|nr:Uncharacterized protein TCM_002597 [Theobroma cacao]